MCVGYAKMRCGDKFNIWYCLEYRDCCVIKKRKDQGCQKVQISSPNYCGYYLLSTVSGIDVTKYKIIGHKLFIGQYVECISSKIYSKMTILKRGYD